MRPPNHHQDKFFLWIMVFLPILSLCTYVFDAYYYYYFRLDNSSSSVYEGLLSTIFIVFAYLQYCAPIESRLLRFIYHLFLWTLIETGHVGYLFAFIQSKKLFSIIVFVGWIIWDILFTLAWLYCRVYHQLDNHIEVENKHIFHFISRLEIILVIFIPIFVNQEFITITRDNIAFFLLFDFFSNHYEHFNSIWIKSCLYLFVTTVTISVASEWLYFGFKKHVFEYVTDISELAAAAFCNLLIIMQFFEFHFKQHTIQDNHQQLEITVIDNKSMVDGH